MAETGVIALDPARLSGLEVYLQGLGDGCRRRAGRVADEIAGSGVRADRPVAELQRLAEVCHRERDDVAWRRAAVEALPDDLPLTGRSYPTRAAARAAALALADDVQAALDARPPRWTRLARLLGELDRSAGTPAFATAFFRALGPRRTRELPFVLEVAWRRGWDPPLGPDGRPRREHPTDADALPVLALQDRFSDALRSASQVQGPGELGEGWCRSYAGLPHDDDAIAGAEEAATPAQRDEAHRLESTLREAGYGSGLAATVARAVGWRRAAAALTAQRGILGLVTAPMALLDDDGAACDGPEALLGTAAAGLVVVGAALPATAPASLAAGVLGTLALVFGTCRRQEARPNETRPTVDPDSGESRLPSGHQTNPNVDGAGVPLPPAYG